MTSSADQIQLYPARRAVSFAVAAALAALGIGVAAPGMWMVGLALAGLVGGLFVADWAMCARASGLELSVSAPRRVSLGQDAKAVLKTGFAGRSPAVRQAALTTDPELKLAPHVSALDPDGEAAFALTPVRRGLRRLHSAQLRWRGPLGMVWRQLDRPLEREIEATPDLRPAREAAMLLSSRNPMGLKPDRRQGGGSEFQALRPFTQGEDIRAIDWKRSARHHSLLIKEFRDEQNHNLVLAIDAGRQMVEPVEGEPRLDRALGAALALGYAGLHAGDRVKLYGFDARPRLSGPFLTGVRAFDDLQGLAARLDYGTAETNATLGLYTLAGELERRSLVAVFTEFSDTTGAELMLEAVGRLVRRHLVVFAVLRDQELEALAGAEPKEPADVSRAVIAGGLLRERALVIERLRRLGVRVVQADHRRLAPALVEAYQAIKRQDLI